jgi:hypothetical protein
MTSDMTLAQLVRYNGLCPRPHAAKYYLTPHRRGRGGAKVQLREVPRAVEVSPGTWQAQEPFCEAVRILSLFL